MKGTFQEFKNQYLEELGQEGKLEYEAALREFKIAAKLKEIRKEMNLSQREFAKIINKPQSTIARVENGSMSPTVGLLEEIAILSNKELKVEFVNR